MCRGEVINQYEMRLHVHQLYGTGNINESDSLGNDSDNFDVSNDIMLEDTSNLNPDEELEIVYQTNDVEGLGAGSRTHSQLSQSRVDTESHLPIDLTRAKQSSENAYYTLEPIFKELLNSISTMEQLETARSGLERLNFDIICSGNKKKIKKGETTFLGEVNGSRQVETRHKALYERS